MKTIFSTPAHLSIDAYGTVSSQKWNHSDLSLEEVLDAFYGLLIAQTWQPELILHCMEIFVNERKKEFPAPGYLRTMGATLPPAPGDPDDYDDIMLGNHY